MAVNDPRTTTRPSPPKTDKLKLEMLEPSLAMAREQEYENKAHYNGAGTAKRRTEGEEANQKVTQAA